MGGGQRCSGRNGRWMEGGGEMLEGDGWWKVIGLVGREGYAEGDWWMRDEGLRVRITV